MKREREVEDLKCLAIKTTFSGLSLTQKRKLIPQLLKEAKMMHSVNIDHIEEKFKRWLCRGRKKLYANEDVLKLWKIWNLIKELAYGSRYAKIEGKRNYYIHIYHPDYDGLYEWNLTNFFNGEEDSDDSDEEKVMTKKDFFDWILDNTIPEEIFLDYPYNTPLYNFPDKKCLWQNCKCNMTKRGLEKYHNVKNEK